MQNFYTSVNVMVSFPKDFTCWTTKGALFLIKKKKIVMKQNRWVLRLG